MTMSASEPTAIRPLRGYKLKIFAAFVLVIATNFCGPIIRPSTPIKTNYIINKINSVLKQRQMFRQ